MALHPAENRGYRELFLSGRGASRRLAAMAQAFDGRAAAEPLARSARAIGEMLDALRPLIERHDLHSRPAAEGGGARLGSLRSGVLDRFLERNQALRLAVCDVDHLATLLGYLANVGEGRGEAELPELCRSWERRLRRHAGAVRRAAIELGDEPDVAVQPLHASASGRAAHRLAWAVGTVGEWTDRRSSRFRAR